MEELVVVLDGLEDSSVPRFTRGQNFSIIPRPGGRLEFRFTGELARLVRESTDEAGVPAKAAVLAMILEGLREMGEAR